MKEKFLLLLNYQLYLPKILKNIVKMMKNLSIYLNIILFVLVFVLYIDRFAITKSGNNSSGQISGAAKATGGIVFINMDSLLNSYDLYNDLRTQFLQKQKQHETNLNSKAKAYERKAMEFQNKVDKQLITQRDAQQVQQSLMAEQQGLMQLKDQLTGELAQDEQSMNKQIYENISNFLKDYNKTHNYKLIISNSVGGVLLYGDKSLNITDTVLTVLNQRYNSSNKTTPNKEEKK
jgi:outer membrane protein